MADSWALARALLLLTLAAPCTPFVGQIGSHYRSVPGGSQGISLCRDRPSVLMRSRGPAAAVGGIAALRACARGEGDADVGHRQLEELQKKLGVQFRDRSLLENALVHRSSVDDHLESNERLEFLGDAVLGMVVAERLFREMPGLREGSLTGIRKEVVSKNALARVAREHGLGQYLAMSTNEANTGGRNKANALADLVESIIAAVFLDQGLDAARTLVDCWFRDLLQEAGQNPGHGTDYKTRLQEEMAKLRLGAPVYSSVHSGPGHKQKFTATISTQVDQRIAWGTGKSKKSAEQDAAQYALQIIETMEESDFEKMRAGEPCQSPESSSRSPS